MIQVSIGLYKILSLVDMVYIQLVFNSNTGYYSDNNGVYKTTDSGNLDNSKHHNQHW